MKRVKIVVAYDGTNYCGWQVQPNGLSVQEVLEKHLSDLLGEEIRITGASRTDAGVHAFGQVANFHLDTELTDGELKKYLNRYLPEDVVVLSCEEAPERFHARLNATGKTYRYRIWNGTVRNVFDRRFVWQIEEPLDLEAMKEAAQALVGRHDFASFTSAKSKKKSTVRTVSEIGIRKEGGEVVLTFTGDGFLYHMVRILTGTLVEAGLGKRPADGMERILAAKNRQEAGMLAPACGLALMEVYYP